MLLVLKGTDFRVVMETISYISLCCVHYYSLNSFSTKEANSCLRTYILTKRRRDTAQTWKPSYCTYISLYVEQKFNPQVAFSVKQKHPKTVDEAVAAMLEMAVVHLGGALAPP